MTTKEQELRDLANMFKRVIASHGAQETFRTLYNAFMPTSPAGDAFDFSGLCKAKGRGSELLLSYRMGRKVKK